MIMGTLPGVPSTLPVKNATTGFQDVGNANYPKYKETDVNRLAVNEKTDGAESNPHSSLTLRRADRDLKVGVVQIDGIFEGVAQIPNDLDITSWDEPTTPYDATYPRNHVYESEGGHIREMDDTPGAERIHERHASGTGYEIHPNGTKITRVKKDNYEIITNDDYCHIQGVSRHTIDKGVGLRVEAAGTADNNYNVEVGQGRNVNIEVNGGNINLTTLGSGQEGAGDININASRNLNVQVGGDMNVNVIGNAIENVGKKKDEFVVEGNTKTGKRIDLN